ncbi:ribosomal protein L30, ferredoxin-like fold domain-containing protein [Scheffersomyces amazonensis]|uniref:ribosomal protein L30, ferredoxin-like fold domain-containing protein n=1 Tax=Scheffersomyces amazonensis TaxID=1078765 RepID=UPI00315CBE70
MAVLNSNPEILLRKRKNADRKRIEKQEAAHEKLLKQKRQRKLNQKKKFIRAETLVSNFKSNELEKKRIRNLTKKQQKDKLSQEDDVEATEGDAKLLFIIRIPNHTKGLKIPNKASKILNVLKLTQTNTGVFVKATPSTFALLNLIAPYIIIGKPSLASIRQLFQKRACILTPSEDENEPAKVTKLDNNQLVEDKFEDLGLICIEDLVHEIINLTENFISITSWLLPFKLNPPVNGWGPQAKLAKLIYSEENSKKSISLSQDFILSEVEDIDKIIDQQN